MNRRIAIILVITLLVLAFHWLDRGGAHPVLLKLTRWSVAWVVLNAAFTSSLSVVDPRLQSRVMWLLTMVAFLILVQQPSLRKFLRPGPGA